MINFYDSTSLSYGTQVFGQEPLDVAVKVVLDKIIIKSVDFE